MTVPPFGPPPQSLVQLIFDGSKGLFADHMAMVIGPTPDDGIEFADECGLWLTAILANNGFKLKEMAFDSGLAGFDEGLEAGFAPVSASTMFTNWVLTDGEAQEIEA